MSAAPHNATIIIDGAAYPAAVPAAAVPTRFEVELRQRGRVVRRGTCVAVHGGTMAPDVIVYDRMAFLRTGTVYASGAGPIVRVYDWAPHGLIEGPLPDGGNDGADNGTEARS